MIRSGARSASVTGDPSVLPSMRILARSTLRIADPAKATSSVRGPMRSLALSRSIGEGGAGRFAGGPIKSLKLLRNDCPELAAQACAVYQALRICVIRNIRAVADFSGTLHVWC